jgi:hypothetical protein
MQEKITNRLSLGNSCDHAIQKLVFYLGEKKREKKKTPVVSFL